MIFKINYLADSTMKKPMAEKSVDLYVNIHRPVAIIRTMKIRDQC